VTAVSDFKVWKCANCGFLYDEAVGWPEDGIPPGTRWAEVPDDWICPQCGTEKQDFVMEEV
jgi:rubredoxin